MARERPEGFDGTAAVTRSLLGYGVLAGAFYLVVGSVLASTREGFAPSRHPLSVLMLGDHGWMQRTNLVLTGLMVAAAAAGVARAIEGRRTARRAGALLGAYGVCLVLSGIFPPDPVAGFPPGAASEDPTVAGLLHLVVGALGFLCLAASVVVVATSQAARGDLGRARWSRVAAATIVVTFLVGAVASSSAAGVVSLWVAVVTGWAWLAATAVELYRGVPHPDGPPTAAAQA